MSSNRFVKIGADGAQLTADAAEWEAVLDCNTGLTWSVKEHPVDNHQEAEKVAGELTAAGFDDWRLPTVEELFPLADRTRYSPAIDTDYFPDCKSDWYWTSTPAAHSPSGCAWFVVFYAGVANWDGRGFVGFVRAVRGGQQSAFGPTSRGKHMQYEGAADDDVEVRHGTARVVRRYYEGRR